MTVSPISRRCWPASCPVRSSPPDRAGGQFFLGQIGLLAGDLADGAAGLGGLLGDGGGGVVADRWGERRADHQARSTIAGPRSVAFKPSMHCAAKFSAAGGQQADRLEQVVGGDRHHDVQLEVARLAGDGDRDVVADAPGSDHARPISRITGLTLPGMIEEPGCTAGSSISPMPARGPEPSQRMSLAIFSRQTAMVFSAPLAATTPSIGDLGLEVVGGLAQLEAGPLGEQRADAAANSGWVLMPVPTAVPPSATSRSSLISVRAGGRRPRSIWPA